MLKLFVSKKICVRQNRRVMRLLDTDVFSNYLHITRRTANDARQYCITAVRGNFKFIPGHHFYNESGPFRNEKPTRMTYVSYSYTREANSQTFIKKTELLIVVHA